MIMVSDDAQGCVFDQPVIFQAQGCGETGFRDFIEVRNIWKRHPWSYRCCITILNTLVILLKVLVSLDCTGGREKGQDQGQAQEKAGVNKLDASFQAA